MQYADYMLTLAVVHREAGVEAGGDLVPYFVFRIGEIDALDGPAWRHDILDRDALEVEEVDQDAAVLLWDVLPGLDHHGTQFLDREGGLAALLGFEAQ